MAPRIWIDGKFYDKADAKVSVYDHGLLYGDGVFEGIRAYNGKIFEAEAHIRRLYESARSIRLTIPLKPEEYLAAIEATVRENQVRDCYIRALVTRGVGKLGVSPRSCEKPSVIIIADSITLYPAEMYENGMAVITSSVVRTHPNSLSPRIKSMNYLNNILAKIEAIDAGVPEAIMFNHLGNVAECTGDNLFIVYQGHVYTPMMTDGILGGVTRDVMIRLCARENIPCTEKTLQRHDLYIADECFLTGTAAEAIPVTKIDGRNIGTGMPGPIARKLIQAFKEYVRSL